MGITRLWCPGVLQKCTTLTLTLTPSLSPILSLSLTLTLTLTLTNRYLGSMEEEGIYLTKRRNTIKVDPTLTLTLTPTLTPTRTLTLTPTMAHLQIYR